MSATIRKDREDYYENKCQLWHKNCNELGLTRLTRSSHGVTQILHFFSCPFGTPIATISFVHFPMSDPKDVKLRGEIKRFFSLRS